MANYENGTYTHKMIIDACKRLFCEKGFHETDYSDICKLAHVNRGTIYYHFENKEVIRYEVQLSYMSDLRLIASKYCADRRYVNILAMYLFWNQIHSDCNMRKFALELCNDFPVYTGEKDCTAFYSECYDEMWGYFWEKKDISLLSFATVYGYIISCMRMMCDEPDKYDPSELFEHCVKASVSIWGIPDELMAQIWEETKRYFEKIPKEELKITWEDIAE